MIKTNEWTIADLTKYLVSVKSTLTPEEIERLKATAAFPKEMDADPTVKRTRYFANQLFEPSNTFRSLGLPVIDWGHQIKWRSSSEEGEALVCPLMCVDIFHQPNFSLNWVYNGSPRWICSSIYVRIRMSMWVTFYICRPSLT
jgi:Protein of unknown function (DUF3684)